MAKIGITRRALVQRINRALSKNGQRLVGAQGGRIDAKKRPYSLVDKSRVLRERVDLVVLGRQLDVIRPYEELE